MTSDPTKSVKRITVHFLPALNLPSDVFETSGKAGYQIHSDERAGGIAGYRVYTDSKTTIYPLAVVLKIETSF